MKICIRLFLKTTILLIDPFVRRTPALLLQPYTSRKDFNDINSKFLDS